MAASPARVAPGLAKWVVILASLFFLQMIPAACTSAATLPELFPVLANLPESTALAIQLGWQGLSPLSPVEANYLLELHEDQFVGKGGFRVATATAIREIAVPRELVRAFLTAATKVKLVEKDYEARITHTDDYPSVSVVVPTKQGALIIETQSQPVRSASGKYWDATPWAIRYSERTFVVTDHDLDEALDPLWARLQYDEITGELAKEIKPSNAQGR
jgi:hypothetical protein